MSYGRITQEEKVEVELIQLAVYEGNAHRRPEEDVRFLLRLVNRLNESLNDAVQDTR